MLLDLPYKTEAVAAVAVVFLLYRYVVYRLVLHPLARVPGPWLAAITPVYMYYYMLTLQWNRQVHRLHQQYGPTVRTGPDQVDFDDILAQKDIYIGNMDKSTFYAQYTWFPALLNTFLTIAKEPHRKLRSIVAKHYSKTNATLAGIQEMARRTMAQVVQYLADATLAQPTAAVEVYNLFERMAMDVIGAFCYGEASTDKLMDRLDASARKTIRAFRIGSERWVWTTTLFRWKPYLTTKEQAAAGDHVDEFVWRQTERGAQLDKNPDYVPLIKVLLGGGKSLKELGSEIGDHVAAGHETTAITLSYLVWELLQKEGQVWQQRLRDEVALLGGGVPHLADVEDLPVLNAIINETHRVHAAIPGGEPRVTGANWKVQVGKRDVVIPKGTTVTMQPYSLHRNPELFPNPEVWDPSRWLDDDELLLKQRAKQLMHFGAGVRMCIGLHIATMEMKLVVPSIYSRFSTSTSEEWLRRQYGVADGEGRMQMADKYTTHPQESQCMIEFTRL